MKNVENNCNDNFTKLQNERKMNSKRKDSLSKVELINEISSNNLFTKSNKTLDYSVNLNKRQNEKENKINFPLKNKVNYESLTNTPNSVLNTENSDNGKSSNNNNVRKGNFISGGSNTKNIIENLIENDGN